MEYVRQYQNRINWQNEPSLNTPINETNLNKMDNALNYMDEKLSEAVGGGIVEANPSGSATSSLNKIGINGTVYGISGGGGGSYTAGAGISIANNVITNTRKGALSGVIDEITSGGYAHTQINNALDSITAGGLVVLKAEASGTANTVRIQYGEQASQSQAYRLCDTDLEYTTINVSVGDTIILMFDITGYKLIVLSILNNSGGSGGDSYAGLGIGKMTSFTNNVIDTDIDLHRAPVDGDRLLVYISETVSNPSSIKTYNNGVAVTTGITFGQTYPVGLAMFRYTLLGWNCIQTIAYSAGTGISITGTTISNSAPQLGMNIGYGEVTSVTDGNIGTFNGNADYLDIDFKVNASPYNGSYTLYLAMGGSTVIMKYATLKDSYGSAYDKDIQQGTILHCLSKVSGTGTAQDPFVVKVIDENVIANPTGTPDYNLKKVKVGGYIYDTLGIKPYDAYSISNGGITIHTADPYTFNGQIIAVNTGAHSGTTTNAWYLVLVGNGSSYPIAMTNADGTDFKDALSENELLFVYVDTHNPQKAILLKTAGASGGGGNSMSKTRYTISSSSWSASANASGYYTYSLTLTTLLSTSYAPNVYISGASDSAFSTDTEKAQFSYLDECNLSASNTLVLYAKTKPTSTFYVYVEGQNA